MMIPRTILGPVLLLMALPLHGQQKEQPLDQPENACCCSTYETGLCLIAVDKKVDNELDDTYRKALERWPDPKIKAALEKAQTAWNMYRDANCDAELATYGKGSMGPNMWGLCRITLARQRIHELKRVYLPEH
jgi:uncharacterized protein YecT (DUF1311 family)